MDSLAILQTYRKIIARYIVNERNITSNISVGDTSISVESTRRFNVGEKIAIINNTSQKAEVVVISDIPDYHTITITAPTIASYPHTNSIIRKILGYESGIEGFIQAIYLGEPEVISHYPAITIDLKSRNSEWLTIESTKETYSIDVTVYVLAQDYLTQFELMHTYVDYIEQALFRSFYPLVEPYNTASLRYDVSASDTVIQIEPADITNFEKVCSGWIWLENIDYLLYNRVSRYMGNGIYELTRAVGREMYAGDTVIAPTRHIFNTLPESTQFGTVNKGTMLKAARISVRAEEECWRGVPYVDPLTF